MTEANSYFFTDQDQAQEECQEGYSILLDGVRRLRNWYVGQALRLHKKKVLKLMLETI